MCKLEVDWGEEMWFLGVLADEPGVDSYGLIRGSRGCGFLFFAFLFAIGVGLAVTNGWGMHGFLT